MLKIIKENSSPWRRKIDLNRSIYSIIRSLPSKRQFPQSRDAELEKQTNHLFCRCSAKRFFKFILKQKHFRSYYYEFLSNTFFQIFCLLLKKSDKSSLKILKQNISNAILEFKKHTAESNLHIQVSSELFRILGNKKIDSLNIRRNENLEDYTILLSSESTYLEIDLKNSIRNQIKEISKQIANGKVSA